ncbi:MAG: hypothetical protein NTY66_00610 [Candidatus Vogelbacteria bacterium]|nr:hypothetical protein [Candidatus Vogelbacteria bacterium]
MKKIIKQSFYSPMFLILAPVFFWGLANLALLTISRSLEQSLIEIIFKVFGNYPFSAGWGMGVNNALTNVLFYSAFVLAPVLFALSVYFGVKFLRQSGPSQSKVWRMVNVISVTISGFVLFGILVGIIL